MTTPEKVFQDVMDHTVRKYALQANCDPMKISHTLLVHTVSYFIANYDPKPGLAEEGLDEFTKVFREMLGTAYTTKDGMMKDFMKKLGLHG